jgi:hypothetical protein
MTLPRNREPASRAAFKSIGRSASLHWAKLSADAVLKASPDSTSAHTDSGIVEAPIVVGARELTEFAKNTLSHAQWPNHTSRFVPLSKLPPGQFPWYRRPP